MKINIEKNVVTITSTTGPEFLYLVDSYQKFYNNVSEPLTFTPGKKRKRYLHTKSCSICEKKVKGNAALGMHMKMHRRIDSESVNESI